MKRLRKLALSALVLGVTALVAGSASWSAFSTTTSNSGNSFQAGTVAISDNDNGNALLSLSNAMPGATTTGCIEVTYGGTLPASVRLFGSVSGSLGQYLTLKVTRGTFSGGTNCATNFNADNRNYIGQGNGVVYNGNLSSFPASYDLATDDPDAGTGGTESWTSTEAHVYKLEVTLQNNSAAQGLSSTASFTWEARNQ